MNERLEACVLHDFGGLGDAPNVGVPKENYCTSIYFALLHRLYKYVTNTVNKERGVRLVLTVVSAATNLCRAQLPELEP